MARDEIDWREASSEDCYAEAQQRIAETAERGKAGISLDFSAFRALDRIPEEISDLIGLISLNLSYTNVSDLSHLSGLSSLRELSFSLTKVSDLSPLVSLSALEKLDLGSTRVSDLTPLAGMTALETLYLGSTRVSDLTPLAGLTALETLDLGSTRVSDLSPLVGLSELKDLNFSRTKVSDLSPLVGLSELEDLDFSRTKVSDLSPLVELSNLMFLCIMRTLASDLSPLVDLSELMRLDIERTQVSDLSPLAGVDAWDNFGTFLEIKFKGIPALKPDPRLDEIAQVSDGKERTVQLIEYIKSPEYTQREESESKERIGSMRVEFDEKENKCDYPRPPHGKGSDVLKLAWNALREQARELNSFANKPSINPYFRQSFEQYVQALGKPFEKRNDIELYIIARTLRAALKSTKHELDDGFIGFLEGILLPSEIYLTQSPMVQEFLDTLPPDMQAQETKALQASEAIWNEIRSRNDVLTDTLISKIDDLQQRVEQLENAPPVNNDP